MQSIVAPYGIRSIYGAPYNTRIYDARCVFHPHVACIVALYGVRVLYGAPYNTRIYDAFKSQSTVWCNYDAILYRYLFLAVMQISTPKHCVCSTTGAGLAIQAQQF